MAKCLIKALKAVDLQKHALLFKSLGYDSAGALANFQSSHFNRLNLNEDELSRFIALLDVLKDAMREGKICPHYFHSKLRNSVNKANGNREHVIKAAWTIPIDEPTFYKQPARVTSSSSTTLGNNYENNKSPKPENSRLQTVNRPLMKPQSTFTTSMSARSKKVNQNKIPTQVRTSSQNSSSQIHTNLSNDNIKVRQKRSSSSLTSSSNNHNRRSMSALDVLRLKNQQYEKSSNDDILHQPFTSPKKLAQSKNNSAQTFFGPKMFSNRPAVEHIKVNGYNYGIPTAKRARTASYRTFTRRGFSSGTIFSPSRGGSNISTSYAKPAEIYVYARKRPLLSTETNFNDAIITPDPKRMIITEQKANLDCTSLLKKTEFQFDLVFGAESSNKQIFDHTLLPFIENPNNRQNMTYICFGQTGSDIYCSFYEIYNNQVYDLCNAGKRLFVREDGEKHVNVINLKEILLEHLKQLRGVIENGLSRRHHGRSAFNSNSSRSHAVFQLMLKRKQDNKINFRLVFIDLAGSERAHDAQNNQRQTRREGAQINWSLLALKECIRSIDLVHSHAPFRQSKLTHILRESLVGSNTRTCLMANVSPADDCCQCSLNTLQYAARIREISIKHRQRLRLNQNYQQQQSIYHPPLQTVHHEEKIQHVDDKKFKPATASTPVHRLNNESHSSVNNPVTLIGKGYGDTKTNNHKSIDIDWETVQEDSPITGYHPRTNKQQHPKQSNKKSINYDQQLVNNNGYYLDRNSKSSYFSSSTVSQQQQQQQQKRSFDVNLKCDGGNDRLNQASKKSPGKDYQSQTMSHEADTFNQSSEILKHKNEFCAPSLYQNSSMTKVAQATTGSGYESESSSTITEQRPHDYSTIYNKNIQNRAINPPYPAKNLNTHSTDDMTDTNPYYSSTGTESLGTKISRLAKDPVNNGIKKYAHSRPVENLYLNNGNYDTTDTEQGVMYSDRPSQATNNDQTGLFTQRDDPSYELANLKFNSAYSPNARLTSRSETKYDGIRTGVDNKGTSDPFLLPFSALETIAHHTNTHSSSKSSPRSYNSKAYWLDDNGMKLILNTTPTRTNTSSYYTEMSQYIPTSNSLSYNQSRKQKLSNSARKRNRNWKQIDNSESDESDVNEFKENRTKSSPLNSKILNKNHPVRYNSLDQAADMKKNIVDWKTEENNNTQQSRTTKTEPSQKHPYNNSSLPTSPSIRQQVQAIIEKNEDIRDRVNQIYSRQEDEDVPSSMLRQTAEHQYRNQFDPSYTSINLTNVTQNQSDYDTTTSTTARTNFSIRVSEQLNTLRTLLETRLKEDEEEEEEDTNNYFSPATKNTSEPSSGRTFLHTYHEQQSYTDDKPSHTQSPSKSIFSQDSDDFLTEKKFMSKLQFNNNAISTSDNEVDDEVKNYTQKLTLKEQLQPTSPSNHSYSKYSREVLTDDQTPSSSFSQKYNEIDPKYFPQPNYHSLSSLTNSLNPISQTSTISSGTITSNLAAKIESNEDVPVMNNFNNEQQSTQTSDSERTSQINTPPKNPFTNESDLSSEQFLTHLTKEFNNIDVYDDYKMNTYPLQREYSIQNANDVLLSDKYNNNTGEKTFNNSTSPLFDSGKGSSLFNTNTYSLHALMSGIQNSANLSFIATNNH
ncbi:unnamed protein product [Didymodactylos carnosus]|uniref:Kinesin motor domain-containing protein n=1 Tax=Didymodactylos carnosus TaxID=1234261 RepID=A0A814X8M6_9BILA|nr:unnamed protein product [Didymodactylos carnosus]CAF3978409.1 unnamed protein product [Didymodactylos carnosus]